MLSEEVLLAALVGGIGGLARASYGALKALSRSESINLSYFLVTIFLSLLIGSLLGAVFSSDIRVSALSGFVGTDILENITKSALPTKLTLSQK